MAEPEKPKRGRGRPPGSGNKRGRGGSRIANATRNSTSEVEPTVDLRPVDRRFSNDSSTGHVNADNSVTHDDSPPVISSVEDCDNINASILNLTSTMLGIQKIDKVDWNFQVNLIGEKVSEPRVHFCDLCEQPIYTYGRNLPCKHVFCMKCAKSNESNREKCAHCGDKVARIERAGFGTIFMCTHDTECRRTYLSSRDLQAHVQHRHTRKSSDGGSGPSSGGLLSPGLIRDGRKKVKLAYPAALLSEEDSEQKIITVRTSALPPHLSSWSGSIGSSAGSSVSKGSRRDASLPTDPRVRNSASSRTTSSTSVFNSKHYYKK